MGVEGIKCLVTGGCGLVGQRLVEMLVERGAGSVVSFDIAPRPKDALEDARVVYMQADLSNQEDVEKACEGVDCVWHIAALVGPLHSVDKYMQVNYQGTLNVLEACRKHGVRKVVMSSSPSTRFDGSDIDGLTEDQLKVPQKFLQKYAESKFMGEEAMLKANSDDFFSVAIAPHQVYGPRDMLFLHNLLHAHGSGKLRVFGDGHNRISLTYVDNYCHGLILGYDALYKGSPALGKFYIVTDGGWRYLWRFLDDAGTELGFYSLFSRVHLPTWLMTPVAHVCDVIGWLLGRKLKLNPFSVRMITMHRWFNINNARRDLKYAPVVSTEEAWARTMAWFKAEWLPKQNF